MPMLSDLTRVRCWHHWQVSQQAYRTCWFLFQNGSLLSSVERASICSSPDCCTWLALVFITNRIFCSPVVRIPVYAYCPSSYVLFIGLMVYAIKKISQNRGQFYEANQVSLQGPERHLKTKAAYCLTVNSKTDNCMTICENYAWFGPFMTEKIKIIYGLCWTQLLHHHRDVWVPGALQPAG